MTIHVHYSLTADDYREYQLTYLARIAGFWFRNHLKIFVTFGTIVFVAGLNWICFAHRENYPGYVSIVGGLYLIFAGTWGRLKWIRWFRKNKRLYQDLDGEIIDESVTVRSKTEESRTKWEHYSGFVVCENILVLQNLHGDFVILPKRAFEPGDLESFLNLLRSKLGDAAC